MVQPELKSESKVKKLLGQLVKLGDKFQLVVPIGFAIDKDMANGFVGDICV